MQQHVSLGALKSHGVVVDGRIMDNGEKRFSLKVGGVGYIWTEPPDDKAPGWQNAHYHAGLRETYIVERGTIALAYNYRFDGRSDFRNLVEIFNQGDMFTVEPLEQHNVYLFAGSAIHTVQHGTPVPNPAKTSGVDWYEAHPVFDSWSKSLSEEGMKQLDSQNMHRHQ